MHTKAFLLLIFSISISWCSAQDAPDKMISRLYEQGRYREAGDLCTEKIAQYTSSNPLYGKILSLRASCFMKLEDFSRASSDYTMLISIYPDSIDYLVNAAYAYRMNGEKVRSMQLLKKARALAPQDPLILSNLSYDCAEDSLFRECVDYASEGLLLPGLTPQLRALLLNNRSLGYLNLSQTDSALQDVNRSLQLYPQNSFAFYHRALIYIRLGKMDEACSDLHRARELGGVNMTRALLTVHCKRSGE